MGSKKGYKAVSERDVLDAVKPVEAKWGIYSYPYSREIVEMETLETETSYGKKTSFFERMKTVYRFVNIENPEEYVEMTVFSVGIDNQDKGDGKAMTYADKYALMKAYKISTGDDPDAEPSLEERYVQTNQQQPQQMQSPLICSDCRNPIFNSKKSDGSVWTAYEIMEYTSRKFGRPLCTNCAMNIRHAN